MEVGGNLGTQGYVYIYIYIYTHTYYVRVRFRAYGLSAVRRGRWRLRSGRWRCITCMIVWLCRVVWLCLTTIISPPTPTIMTPAWHIFWGGTHRSALWSPQHISPRGLCSWGILINTINHIVYFTQGALQWIYVYSGSGWQVWFSLSSPLTSAGTRPGTWGHNNQYLQVITNQRHSNYKMITYIYIYIYIHYDISIYIISYQ